MARFDLKLSEEEFWELTPRLFDLLVQRHRAEIERQELLTGIVASAVANWSMGAPETKLLPSAFMPSEWVKKAKEKARLDLEAAKRRQTALNIGLFMKAQMARKKK